MALHLKNESKERVGKQSLITSKSLKSASQIVEEQVCGPPSAPKVGHSRRVYPLVSLNPYEGNWTIKVRVTSKSPMRTYSNARGQGNVFTVELTDEEGTQIQATMFKEAADMFVSKIQLGKMYYISKGSLRAANKRFSTLRNDYEMTLNQYSEVQEIVEEEGKAFAVIPQVVFNFVRIDHLGPFVSGRALIDVIGVVKDVAAGATVRRRIDNTEISKRDITITDQSQKSVVLTLWNELASEEGCKLFDMLSEAPTVAVKGLKVSDYQGVSLSTTNRSVVQINPDIPDGHALRQWYDEDGKWANLVPAGANLPGMHMSNPAERACISEITEPSVGDGKPAYFSVRACINFIRPDQAMWYLACTSCTKKVVESGSTFWCEGCQKSFDSCKRRYIMLAKMSDASGEAWISAFNEQAEYILGCTAEALNDLKSQEADQKSYQRALKEASWVTRLFRVSVSQNEYMNEKRQRITVRSVSAVDWSAESKLLIEKIKAACRPRVKQELFTPQQ